MIKAIVFDFDGLVIDTETPAYEAFRDVYLTYGVELSLNTYAQCIGTSFAVFNPFNYLVEQLGSEVDMETVKRQVDERHHMLLEQATLRPGVLEYLNDAREGGLRIGLATSSPLSWINPYFDRFELRPYFDSITTADEVANVKPDPELYLKSLEKLNVSGNEAIAFEDSLNGLRAAKAAGLHCTVVPNPSTRHFPFENHDLKLESMDEMSLADVIRRIETGEARPS